MPKLSIDALRLIWAIAPSTLIAQGDYKRIMTLVYTVEFPKNSEKEISVSYNISGTMDKTVGNLQNSFWYFAPFVIVALILLIRIIIIVIILKRNKNR